jgi:hypothetical protein
MSKLEVREIGPISGETDLTLGQSGGTVTLADGAVPIGWDKAGYTAAYSVAAHFPDSDAQVKTGFMPIALESGSNSVGANFIVSQPPIGIEVVGSGEPEDNVLKIKQSGVYLIYTAVSSRTNGSSTPIDKIWSNAYVNGVDVRHPDTIYSPPDFAMRKDSNSTSYIYHTIGNDTWAGLLNEGDEVQFFYYAKSKSGYVRVSGLVGSIIYVGDSD